MSKKSKKAKKNFFWPPPIGSHYWWMNIDHLIYRYDYNNAMHQLKLCAALVTDESEQALMAEKENYGEEKSAEVAEI